MKMRLFLSLIAFTFASAILGISLMTAPIASSTGAKPSTEKRFYIGDILPDSVFYPALMAVDRIQLETASQADQVFMQIEYAHRRLGYAEELLNQQKEDLAMATLVKAETYLANSAHEAIQIQAPASVKERISRAIEYHIKRLKELSPNLTDADRATVDRLIEQDQLLIQQLQ